MQTHDEVGGANEFCIRLVAENFMDTESMSGMTAESMKDSGGREFA